MPFLSVIVPVYNADKYLSDCFDSILKQDFNDYEVIIVDDGSKDKSPEICDQYAEKDNRFKVFHVENGGPSKARNLGFRKAVGKYLYCIDNDDYILTSNYFSKINSFLSQNDTQVLLTGASYKNDFMDGFSKQLDFKNINFTSEITGDKIYTLIANKSYETSCWTKVIDRKFLIDNEFFFDEDLLIEDLDWNMRFLKKTEKFQIFRCSDYVHVYRSGSVSNSFGEKRYKSCLDQITSIKNAMALYENYTENEKLKTALFSYLSYQFYITVGKAAALDKDYHKIIKKKLLEIDSITNYSIEKRQKTLKFIYKFFGYKVSEILLGYYYDNRTASKKKS